MRYPMIDVKESKRQNQGGNDLDINSMSSMACSRAVISDPNCIPDSSSEEDMDNS